MFQQTYNIPKQNRNKHNAHNFVVQACSNIILWLNK